MKIPYKQNMGIIDRIIRICIGLILMIPGIYLLTETVGIVLIILSILFLITGISGFCPGYIPLGISTNRESGNCLK